jgi:hypothetical protein
MNEHARVEKLLEDIVELLKAIRNYTLFVGAAIFIMIWVSGCSGWVYNGVRGEDLQHPTLEMAAGVGTAFVVHATGHFVAMSIMGHELHFEGLSEVTDDELTDSEAAWFGRAGFLAADGVGWVAKALGARGDFWRGYNAGVVFETATYPMWQPVRGDGDDLRLIDRDGDGNLEWGLWSAAAIGLNFENTKVKGR